VPAPMTVLNQTSAVSGGVIRKEPGQAVALSRLIARCVQPPPMGGLKYSRSGFPPPGSCGTFQVVMSVGT
jgi:hypothetical protein